tara:strand:+ start:4453 stop:4674 length:222 start_codon:yes stop_codon:yes gene_type:complete
MRSPSQIKIRTSELYASLPLEYRRWLTNFVNFWVLVTRTDAGSSGVAQAVAVGGAVAVAIGGAAMLVARLFGA